MSARRGHSAATTTPGSLADSQHEFLAVGKLRRTHGLSGEILMDIYTDFSERLRRGVVLYLGEEHQPVCLRSVRQFQDGLLVAFEGYSNPEEAAPLRNQLLYVPASDRPPLPEGEYYHHQVLGLRVVDQDDQVLGNVADILSTGANDVYVVRSETAPEILLPAIDSVILTIDLAAGVMKVHLLPGLIQDKK